MAASAKGEHPQSGDTDGISVRKFQVTKLKKESFRPATESARRGFVFVCQCAWFGEGETSRRSFSATTPPRTGSSGG